MDTVERLAARIECEELLNRYGFLIDGGKASRVAEIFTEDGIWESNSAVVRGAEAIDAWMLVREQQRERESRHIVTNVSIDVVDESTAYGHCYVFEFRSDIAGSELRPEVEPAVIGDYRDDFVRTADGWRIAHRRVEIAFMRPGEKLRVNA